MTGVGGKGKTTQCQMELQKRGGKAHNRGGQRRKRVQGRRIPSLATFNYTSSSAEEVEFKRADGRLAETLNAKYVYKAP